MTVNEPLLRECIAAIEANPEQWDQMFWQVDWVERNAMAEAGVLVPFNYRSCGTTRCLAGWAIHLAHNTEDVNGFCGLRHPGDIAAELLGFDDYQRGQLFGQRSASPNDRYGENDLNYFKKKITEVTGVEFKVEEEE